MSTLRHPVGPHAPAVYWRRRVVVLVVLVLLVVIPVRACGAGGGSGDDAQKASQDGADDARGPDPSATITPTGTPGGGYEAEGTDDGGASGSSGGGGGEPAQGSGGGSGSGSDTGEGGGSARAVDPGTCPKDDLRVGVRADKETYQADQQPRIEVWVVNIGKKACTVNTGGDAIVLEITSGPDRIWNSHDCDDGKPEMQDVAADGGLVSRSVTWKRERSKPECPKGLPEVKPGTYHVTAALVDIGTARTFFLLR